MYAANWHPLTWISHLVDYSLFGLNASGHHLTSLLMHAVSSTVLLLVLYRATRALWPSVMTAMLFAVHPLRVESVAWVAERKDVLSTLLFMLTVAAYVHYTRRRSIARYCVVFVLYACGLLAKPMLVTVPLVMLLMDVWPLRRVSVAAVRSSQFLQVVAEKLPLAALAAASCVITIIAQERSGAIASLETVAVPTRLLNAIISYIRYMWMFVYPSGLAVFYPYPRRTSVAAALAAALLVVAISTLSIRQAIKRPYVFVGWWWYVLTLIPVIGILQAGRQAYADRYTYIPQIGILVAVVWTAAEGTSKYGIPRHIVGIASWMLVATYATCTYSQAQEWSSSKTLFQHALEVTSENDVAYLNLGAALDHDGDFEGAMRNYKAVLRLEPNSADARNDLGEVLEKQGDHMGAIDEFMQALALTDGRDAAAHYNLARVLAAEEKLTEAEKHYRTAITLRPTYVEARNNLGQLMLREGKFAEAVAELKETVRLRPDFANAHNNLGVALRRSGDVQGAIGEYQSAIRVDGRSVEAYHNLGNVLAQVGRNEEADVAYTAAVAIKPNDAETYIDWGDTLARRGKFVGAARLFAEALRVQPDNQEAHDKYERARALEDAAN